MGFHSPQIDERESFLNGKLGEDISMKQLLRFMEEEKDNPIWKLKKD